MPENDNTAERVIKILASVKHIPQESIQLESKLQEDLHFDSLDVIILLSEMEQEFSLSIPDDAVRHVKTVSDVVEGIKMLAAQPKPAPPVPPVPPVPQTTDPQTNNG
jgi:acyl carrier protein